MELASSVQGSEHRATCNMVERAYTASTDRRGWWGVGMLRWQRGVGD